MRLLVFGAAGTVGRATVAEAQRRGWAVTGLSRAEAEIGDRQRVREAIAAFRPQLVANCAAFTAVDSCESEPEMAFAVNGRAVGLLAEECDRAAARLVHLSTDYVFDGLASTPYFEDDATAPASVYGASKLEGERRALAHSSALVVRTSWVFGVGGSNFVDTMVGKLRRGELPLRVVADQRGAPTYAPFLARALADLGEFGAQGIVHYRNREAVSWFELAREIATRVAPEAEVVPVTTAEVPRPARRPPFSVLDVGRFESIVSRAVEPWAEGLDRHLAASFEERE